MAIAISLILFVVLVTVISYIGYRQYARPGRVYQQLGGQAAVFNMPEVDTIHGGAPGLLVQVIEQIGEKIPMDPLDATSIRRDLIAAGFRSDQAVTIYVGIRVVAAVVLVILALVFRGFITSPILPVVLPVAAGVFGYFGPSFFLDHLITGRQERIRYGLPDALDLMVVSVEAGLGLDQAIQYVSRELKTVHPEVSEELELVNLEMRGGRRRIDALRNLADRTGEPELKKLVAILVQTDRFGTSIADSLRTHADFMRVRRRQDAETRANKVGVKLVFPIFFLILPSMLVVAAGPGLLQVFKQLIPMMRQFHR